MQTPLIAVLVLVLAILVGRAIGRERRQYGEFKRMRETADRQRVYRRWLTESFVVLGGLSLVILFAASDAVTPTLERMRSLPGVRDVLHLAGGWVAFALVAAVVAALVALLVITVTVGRTIDELPTVGDVGALLPRNREELRWGALLALNAGLVEELLFRFALPALIFAITGSALLGFVGAIVVFGGLHLYQRATGMIAATILGVVFTLLYVLSDSILVPMLVHALIDLRSLVLLPVVVHRVHRIRAGSAEGAEVSPGPS